MFPCSPSTADQALQGLPTITQLAPRSPSRHCTQTLFHIFLLLPPSSSVCFGCPLLFPNGNFEVDWCCLFWANGSTHKRGIGWGMGQSLKRDSKKLAGESLSFNRQWGNLKTAPMCSLFQLGFDRKWSTAIAGRHAATWLKCRVCTHRKWTYSVQYSPSVNHIHSLKTSAKQKTVLSQTPLPVSAYNITKIWFMAIQKVTEVYRNAVLPFKSTNIHILYLIFSQRKATKNKTFFFPPQNNLLHISGFQSWGLPVGHRLLLPALLKGKQTYDFEENSITHSLAQVVKKSQ